jgi:hypothetical protein
MLDKVDIVNQLPDWINQVIGHSGRNEGATIFADVSLQPGKTGEIC